MSHEPPPSRAERFALWTADQRRVLIFLLLVLAVYFAIRYALHPTYISDPQPRTPPRSYDLADKIDPNEADWPTLAALPNIGEKRAKDIVAYREQFQRANPGQRAFSSYEDLLRIRGIGPSIALQIRPYLIFPTRATTTRNSG